MSQGAMRTHAIIALEGNYWCELKGDSAVVNFITDEQIREMANTADSYRQQQKAGAADTSYCSSFGCIGSSPGRWSMAISTCSTRCSGVRSASASSWESSHERRTGRLADWPSVASL